MLPTRREFVERCRGYAGVRPAFRWGRVLAACLLFVPAFAYLAFQELYLRGRFERGWLDASTIAFLLLLAAPVVFLGSRFVRWDEQQVQQYGLTCPGCGERLTGVQGAIAVASGYCGKCGERIHCGDGPAGPNPAGGNS